MVFNPFAYIKESKEELDKVIWPTRAETIKLTLIVIGVSILVGAYISGIDAIMAKISTNFLIK